MSGTARARAVVAGNAPVTQENLHMSVTTAAAVSPTTLPAAPEGMITITCADCPTIRTIFPQDAFQVKRCKECQKKHRNQLARDKRAEKRKAKEAALNTAAAKRKKVDDEKAKKKLAKGKKKAEDEPVLNSDEVRAKLAANGPETEPAEPAKT